MTPRKTGELKHPASSIFWSPVNPPFSTLRWLLPNYSAPVTALKTKVSDYTSKTRFCA